jgi:hypothetical protein
MSTMRSCSPTANVAAGRRRHRRRSSTASRFAPQIKRGSKGYDAGKKITGRKRHIPTDTDGRLLTVRVHGADVQDHGGGKLPLKNSRSRYPFVARVFADGGYAGRLVHWAADKTRITLKIIRRRAHAQGL